MHTSKKHRITLIGLVLSLPLVIYVHLISGQIDVSFNDYIEALFSYNSENTNHFIAREIRIPRMFMALFAGAGLSVAGL